MLRQTTATSENSTLEVSRFDDVTTSQIDLTAFNDSQDASHGKSQEQILAGIFVPIFFGIIFCVGLVGNALVITVITKIYRRQPHGMNNTNRFILNLAISDMFFLLFCVPFQAPLYSMDGWPFGSFMCVFCEVCQKVTMLASVYSLVALSFDRFFAVVFATSTKPVRTKKNAYRGIITIWVFACGLGAPSALTREEVDYYGIMLCIPSALKMNRWYQLMICILGYVFPLLLILFCYVGVLSTLRKSAQNLPKPSRSKNRMDSRKRVTTIVVIIVLLFAIDWFLHHMTTLWRMFGGFPFTPVTYVITVLAHCMSYANSSLNPVVYAFVSQTFRKDFKRACTCQYISDAVGSFKAYSQRMVSSINTKLRNTNARGRSADAGENVTPAILLPRHPVISAASRRHDGPYEVIVDQHATSMFLLTPVPTPKAASRTMRSFDTFNTSRDPSPDRKTLEGRGGDRLAATTNGVASSEKQLYEETLLLVNREEPLETSLRLDNRPSNDAKI